MNLLRLTLLPICAVLIFGICYSAGNYSSKLENSTLISQENFDKVCTEKDTVKIKSLEEYLFADSLTDPESSDKTILLAKKDSIKQELIKETRAYILKTVPQAKSNIDMVVEPMVEHALGNNIELSFMLAQAQLETAFGTAGIGRSNSKKSMFGFMKRKYQTYEDCILHYVETLNKSYLVRGKTIHDLMKKYVNANGHRYASSTSYETKIKKQYLNIKSRTKIDNLENEYRKVENLLKK